MRYYLLIPVCLALTSPLQAADQRPIDRQTIAITIAAEAAGEGYDGMYRVANTIRNRAIKYRMAPDQVVKQRNQYYGYTAKNRIKHYNSVRKQADYLATNIMQLPDKTGGAIYFRQLKEPCFKWCKVETARHKNHIFYK